MRKNPLSQNVSLVDLALNRAASRNSPIRRVRLPIACIAVGSAVLYFTERSVASMFLSGRSEPFGFTALEAVASAKIRNWGSSNTASGQALANRPATATAPRRRLLATTTPPSTSVPMDAGATPSVSMLTSSRQPADLAKAPAASSDFFAPLVAPVSGGSGGILPDATINGAGWQGDNSTSWNDTGNWAGTPPSTDERNLFYGTAWVSAGSNGSTTSNNDIAGYSGYRITFDNIANPVTFTLQGNALTLFNITTAADTGRQSSAIQAQIRT